MHMLRVIVLVKCPFFSLNVANWRTVRYLHVLTAL